MTMYRFALASFTLLATVLVVWVAVIAWAAVEVLG